MAGRVVDCPNCGGQVEFKAGTSLLSVCGFCSSAVARVGDDVGELEILGKVAPLAEIGSPLGIGIRGQLHREEFIIVGRLQLNYGSGPWNEWYLAFDDGRWAWLAEAQGRVYVTFNAEVEDLISENPKLTANGDLPSFEAWDAGTRFHYQGQILTVTERRKAEFVSAEGELPFAVPLDSEFGYCDFEGRRGIFGTLDFGSGDALESVFFGREHGYEDLFDKDTLDNIAAAEALAGVAMNCPNCGGAVELQAPMESERVTCGSCESLLDCSKGNELYLLAAASKRGKMPTIPLGSVAKHKGKKWTVFGYLIRSVSFAGVNYPWEEYLLRADGGGYRWLICSDGHWSWIEPASAAEVDLKGRNKANYRGQVFRHYQTATATVDYLRGEFYWKVKVGDQVEAMDYIAPPLLLGCERRVEQGETEIQWSVGRYLSTDEMSEIFGAKVQFPRPAASVAPHQPNPHSETVARLNKMALIFSAILLVGAMVYSLAAPSSTIFETRKQAVPYKSTDKAAAARATFLTEPFELSRAGNIQIKLSSNVNNSWLFVNGALINEAKGQVRYFAAENSYYSGRSGGGSWSEGSRSSAVYLGSVEAGTYIMSFKPQTGVTPGSASPSYEIQVRHGIFFRSHLIAFVLLIWAFPFLIRIRSNRFEHRRWEESDYGGANA